VGGDGAKRVKQNAEKRSAESSGPYSGVDVDDAGVIGEIAAIAL
jgi:hypothetical protein